MTDTPSSAYPVTTVWFEGKPSFLRYKHRMLTILEEATEILFKSGGDTVYSHQKYLFLFDFHLAK